MSTPADLARANAAAAKSVCDRLVALAQRVGTSVVRAELVANYLRVDFARADDEMRIRTLLAQFSPSWIRLMPRDAKGRHLDDSTDHRLVARLKTTGAA